MVSNYISCYPKVRSALNIFFWDQILSFSMFFCQKPLSSLSTFKTFPHMFPCTVFEIFLMKCIESCKLPFKVWKKTQPEPSPLWNQTLRNIENIKCHQGIKQLTLILFPSTFGILINYLELFHCSPRKSQSMHGNPREKEKLVFVIVLVIFS